MPKRIVSSSKQTDAHRYKATPRSALLQKAVDAESFLAGNEKRNRGGGKKNSLGRSNVKILYLVLAAVPCSLLKCVAGEVFFRHLSLLVVRDKELSWVGRGPLLIWPFLCPGV